MASNKLMTTVQTPSRFALPTCGHAFEATVWGVDSGSFAGIATSFVERERTATQITIKGGLGLVPAYVPGTSAWSPPTS